MFFVFGSFVNENKTCVFVGIRVLLNGFVDAFPQRPRFEFGDRFNSKYI